METLIATAFALVFGTCWVMELRINAKLREHHMDTLLKLQNEHADNINQAIGKAHATGWEEGRQYEINRRNAQHPRKFNTGQFTERTKQ